MPQYASASMSSAISMATEVEAYLKKLGDADIATHAQGFFKTGKGGYGHGDVFIGIRVPVIRQALVDFKDLPHEAVETLVQSPYHEVRLFAVLFWCKRFTQKTTDALLRRRIYQSYVQHMDWVNNWDIVDGSAPGIVGGYLYEDDRSVLYKWAASPNLWHRRVAVMATYYFIKKQDFADTLALAELLLGDGEDLIHKAVGWMLREVGNRDKAVEVAFLDAHCLKMPRTMLRYAIEKFDKTERQTYLQRR